MISLCVGAIGMLSNALDELSSKVSLLMEQEKHVFHCVCCMFDSMLVCLLVRQQRCAKATEQNSMKPDEEVARGKGRTH